MKRKLSAIAVAMALAYGMTGQALAGGASSEVDQDGSNNIANITQTGTGPFGHGPTTATVHQNGNGNTADVTQNFVDGPSASVSQTGDGNHATVSQFDLINAKATVSQRGNANNASITQTDGFSSGGSGFANNASASVNQD